MARLMQQSCKAIFLPLRSWLLKSLSATEMADHSLNTESHAGSKTRGSGSPTETPTIQSSLARIESRRWCRHPSSLRQADSGICAVRRRKVPFCGCSPRMFRGPRVTGRT